MQQAMSMLESLSGKENDRHREGTNMVWHECIVSHIFYYFRGY